MASLSTETTLTSWPFSSGGSSALSGSSLLVGIGLNAVDATPPGLERDLAAGAEALVLDHGDDGRPRVARRRMEHGQEAAGDEIEDTALVGRELADVVLDVGGDDRVVVTDLCVVHDPGERKRVEPEHELRRGRVLGDVDERPRRRLQLWDEVAGKPAGARARVRDRLLALVQGLRGLQGSPRGEPEAAVRIALKRRQVVEERRALGLLLALEVVDGPRLAGNLLDDLFGALGLLEPGLLAVGVSLSSALIGSNQRPS